VAQGGQSGARVRACPGNSRLDGGVRAGKGAGSGDGGERVWAGEGVGSRWWGDP